MVNSFLCEEEFELPNVEHVSIILDYGYLLPRCAKPGATENLNGEIQDLSRN